MRAMFTAATGMDAQTQRIDTIANNLANANTTGFKKSQVDFTDLMYAAVRRPGGNQTSNTHTPTGLEIGTGVTPASTLKIFTPGTIHNTDGELDVAINGHGFFQVETHTGEIRYTRDGNLRMDSEGTLVTSKGNPIYPRMTLPTDSEAISIGADGTVTVQTPGDDPSQVGTIELARFTNPAGLSSEGGNLLAETMASGAPTTGTPGNDGLGELQQGYLEGSNVEEVNELVDLISAQRTYELNSRVVRAGDRVMQAANQIVA